MNAGTARLPGWGAALALALLAGCGSQDGYHAAFHPKEALSGNSRVFQAVPEDAFTAVKLTLVKQGFTVEQADLRSGIIKAARNLQDAEDPSVSYNISATADLTRAAAANGTMVTLAASQQTVLHRQWHTWWHLLWIIPLFPTGTEYQTVVTSEGSIRKESFYEDFFNAVGNTLTSQAAPAPSAAPARGEAAGPGEPIFAPAPAAGSPERVPLKD